MSKSRQMRLPFMMLPIDKGIPQPKANTHKRQPMDYPWQRMVPGDSFLVPGASAATMSGLAYRASVKWGLFFSIRQMSDGVRVWRTA